MKKTGFLSIFLTLALVLSMASYALAANEDAYATRGHIADLLLVAADDYSPGLQKSDIIHGDEGGLREDGFVTRAEAFVMISRAFGPLEPPTGHNARITMTDLSYDDVYDWAKADVENLARGGALAGTGASRLSPGDYVTEKQVQLVIDRIMTLKAEHLKDSFYATANKDMLDALTIRPGATSAGTFATLTDLNTDRITQIIQETLSGSHKRGSAEQKIGDFYLSVADTEGRNAAGNAPIQPYLNAIDKLRSLADLIALRRTVMTETGTGMILYFTPVVDAKDSANYTMYFGNVLQPMLPKDQYTDDSSEAIAIYQDYLTSLYRLLGLSPEEAAANTEHYFKLEQTMAAVMMAAQDYSNIDKIYNPYTIEQIQALFPSIDLAKLLTGDGFQAEHQYIVTDPATLAAFAKALEGATADELKAYARMNLLMNFASCLSEDYTAAGNEFSRQMYGVEGERSAQEMAALYTQSLMSDYLGKLYIEQHFSAAAKADVENMVSDFIAVYKDRIKNLGWMSDSTKQMALKKLDTMDVKIGYPDNWDSLYDNVEIQSPNNGGSFYSNICAMTLAAHKDNLSLQGSRVDRSDWLISAYTVNAYYNPTANEIVFPAGILQAPFYDINAAREENLGGIGFVIAHEITHSFDNNGAKYDENGNAANWWSAEDYAKFNALCLQVVDYYDGQEFAPGIVNNGTLTLSENIADLGAMACVIQTARSMDSPDYQKLFLNLARCWVSTTSREFMTYISMVDVHSGDAIRVNRAAQSSDVFYEAFDIGPGDGMYIAPESRVSIW